MAVNTKKIRWITGIIAFSFSLNTFAQVDEITVTARKKEESLQEIPLAIKAFDTEEIKRKGIDNFEDIAKNTAGARVQLLGVDQMWCAHWMHIDVCTRFGHLARGSRVVQVDVGQEDVLDLL